MAVLDYGLDDIEPSNLQACENALFIMMKPLIDKSKARYKARCENGKKGGAPKGNENAKKKTTENNRKQAKTTENNLNDNDNYNDNYNENYNDLYNNTNVLFAESDYSNLPPLMLNDGSRYYIPNKDIEQYKQLYSAIDVEQQLRNMVGWLDANPKNRKTRTGIKRFINSWLTREHDRASRTAPKENSMDEAFRQLEEMKARGEL
jgi:hypothetical protein